MPTCPARPQFPALATTGLTITNLSSVIAVKLTTPNDPGESTFIRAASPQRNGVRAMPQVKEIGLCPAPVTGVPNITALYTAAFGAPTVGKRLFVQVYQMVDGWESMTTTYLHRPVTRERLVTHPRVGPAPRRTHTGPSP